MRKLRFHLTYANVASTLCLVLLLGGGAAWAATQLPKNSVGSKQLKKGAVTPAKLSSGARKTISGATGPTGPVGPKGDPGTPGAPGAALGYAHIVEGKLDPALSKGIVGISEGINFAGTVSDATQVCFDLSFTPSSISVTREPYETSSSHIADFFAGTVPGFAPRASHSGCPLEFRDAEVEAATEGGGVPNGFFVVFF